MKYAIIALLILFSNVLVNAQVDHDYFFGKSISVNADILSPGQLSGHKFGEWHFSHDQLVSYMKYLDEKSDRITMVEYGRTYENRPLYTLFVSSPDNLQKLEDIRKNHINAIYSELNTTKNQKDPIIIWLGYSVHGNESSASNSSLLLAYYLAASNEEEINNILNQSIIIIDPCINPDGFNRAASWVNMHESKEWITNQNSIQFTESWPGGRTNHYWFDLNRDWLLAQHPETKGRLSVFHKWKPVVLTDHHEMGTNATFFFQPGALSRNNPLTPFENYELNLKIAQNNSKALDNIGSLYFSGETFDDFYIGKGSSYPDINGGIGILYEQSRVNGQSVDNNNGLTTFSQAIRNHFTVSMSTIRSAVDNKIELQDYQKRFYTSINSLVQKEKIKGYAFACKNDPLRLSYFLQLLEQHEIDVFKNKESIKIKDINYFSNEAYIVPLNQHQFRLIKSIFEKVTAFKDSIFYDISSWTVPLAFNIEYTELTDLSKLMGEKLEKQVPVIGKLQGGISKIGYIFSWSNYNSPKLAQELLSLDIGIKVATKPFQAIIQNKNENFGYGSILIPIVNQKYSIEELFKIVENLSIKNGVDIFALEHGLNYSGIHLGSSNFIPLNAPKILMVIGDRISSFSAGEIWHLLDNRLNIPITRVDADRLSRINLFDFNTLIIPDGEIQFKNSDSKNIETWLKNGGVIISLEKSSQELINQKWIDLKIRNYVKKDSTMRYEYVSARDRIAQDEINGVILNTNIDITHPIGYGFDSKTVPVFKGSDFVIEKNKDEYSCPVYIPKNALLSGYLNDRNQKQLENSAYVLNFSLGKGKLIVFADDPNYRAIWYGTNKLFINAIFFGRIIETDRKPNFE